MLLNTGFTTYSFLAIPLTIVAALLLDFVLGEPRKFHPLVGFGNLANIIEKTLNKKSLFKSRVLVGAVCVFMLISPFVLGLYALQSVFNLALNTIINVVVLYWAIGHHSLREHAYRVLEPCLKGDLTASQQQLSMIVSRNTEQLNEEQVVQATVETVLENGSDAIFSPLFWFFLIEVLFGQGAAAVVLYRLSNTLDAMWGYKNIRFNYFGRTAARLDDVLNYIPARLVAFSYAVLGNTKLALRCWREQSPLLKSPNAGPVMTSGAGSLNVRLGGPAYYHQTLTQKPYFGSDISVKKIDIQRALNLIKNTLILWCCITFIASYLIAYFAIAINA